MGMSPKCAKVKSFEEKSNSKKKKEFQGNEKGKEKIGCWAKFRLMGGCMSSRSKVDSSLSGISTHYGNNLFTDAFFQLLKNHKSILACVVSGSNLPGITMIIFVSFFIGQRCIY